MRDLLATVPILLLIPLLLLPLVLALADTEPTIAVRPTDPAPGQSVRVTGSRFPARSQGVLTLDGASTPIATYSANPRGEFRLKFVLPADIAPGDHQIEARTAVGIEPIAVTTLTVSLDGPPPGPTSAPTADATATVTPAAAATATPSPTPTPTPTPAATPSPTPTPTPTVSSGRCSAEVHARYVTTGPDGRQYPTWHPQRDPSGCHFHHDHGSNPAHFAAADVYGPAYGYLNALAGHPEPHEGFKSFLIDDGNGHHWLWTVHIGTSGAGRVCQRFHSVELAVADASSGGLLAEIRFMGDFGRSESNGTLDDFHPDACPNQAQQAYDDGSTGARQLSINTVGTFSTQYEPWRLDTHQTVFGFDPARSITFNTNSAMTTCGDVDCNTVMPTNHRAAGAYRIIQGAGSFSLTAPASAGRFTTDIYGRTRGGSVPQYVGQGTVIVMQSGRSGYNYWPGTDPDVVLYKLRSNDPTVKDGKGDMGTYNIDGQLRMPN